jgi:hypothetical protein
MMDLDREQLKRDCADALKAVQQDNAVDGLAPLAFTNRRPRANAG